MTENLHTHTVRCGHAQGTEEEYVQAAIAAGFRVLGFSDHAPQPFPTDYRSKVRMTMDALPEYADTVRTLQNRYAEQISVPLGLEAEYYPQCFKELLLRARDNGIEYLILGQHYLHNEYDLNPLVHTFKPTEDPAILDQYCNQLIDGMQTGAFTYVCHPDVVNFVGDPKEYDRQMARICREAKACGLPLEINLWGMYNQKNYPLPHFWELAAQEGNAVVLGSDAHRPDVVNNPECEAVALQLVEQLGLHLLDHIPIHRI